MATGKNLLIAVIITAISGISQAAQFKILDKDNKPVQDVVVLIEDYKNVAGSDKLAAAEMSQSDRRFNPHVLVVPQNTPVTFPNYDSISHHVYSFSEAKVFEKKLYKGVEEAPVIFDTKGIVELGCNVHDWMLAYIYVTDSTHFGVTNESGEVSIDLPKNGEHSITLWHPRMAEGDKGTRKLTVGTDTLVVKLAEAIAVEEDFDFDEFDDY